MIPKGILKAHGKLGRTDEEKPSSHGSTDSSPTVTAGKGAFIAPPSKPAPPGAPGSADSDRHDVPFVPPGMEPTLVPPGGHHTVLSGTDSAADLKLALKLPVGFDTMADLKVAQKAGRIEKTTTEQKAAGALMKGFGGM